MNDRFQYFLEHNLQNSSTDLCQIMNSCGSDKGSGHHNYTTFYHFIFQHLRDRQLNVFELGLGTNDLTIESNMSGRGTPCGSLRGWREYFSQANIFGADIDDKILVSEDRIQTFYCDQTNSSCISSMWQFINRKFDIIIEDGLHNFNANKIFFENSVDVLVDGGIFIIEDIDKSSFSDFENYIDSSRNKYNYMGLIKIPNPRNMSDNNVLVVIK
jgi:SAM-dependent methyltransferase